MLDFRLNTKGLERPSLIKGVRHFDTRKDAIKYASLKYGVEMKYEPDLNCGYAAYRGTRWDHDMQKTVYAYTPAGEWREDHDVLEIRHQWIDKDDNWHDDLIEFVTYADGYTFAYRYSREYNFIETV